MLLGRGEGSVGRQRGEELERPARRLRGLVAVATQLHVNAPIVADFSQRPKHRRKIDFSLAEHQVLVHAAAHILDVHVDQPRRPAADLLGNRSLALALQVADVECQSLVRRIELAEQLFESGHGVDEHARLRLETHDDPLACRVL